MRLRLPSPRIVPLLGWFLVFTTGSPAETYRILDRDLTGATLLADSTLVVLDVDGSIYTTPSGEANYTLRRAVPGGNIESYFDIARDGSTAIAVGSDGFILRSEDSGNTWVNASSPTIFGDLLAVGAGGAPGMTQTWVAVGSAGTNGPVFSSTDNGLTWEQSANLEDVSLYGVVWTGSRWLACGAGFFQEGVIYTTTDRVNWSAVTLPDGTGPLLELATDGSGTVVATGESGRVLRSINGGDSFEVAGDNLVSGDLEAIAWDSGARFLIGGDERVLLELNGPDLRVILEEGPGAPPVRDVMIDGGEVFLAGAFADDPEITPGALQLQIRPGSGNSLELVLAESNPIRVYALEQSTDLESWTLVEDSIRGGTGNTLVWEVPSNAQIFWRVAEF